MEKLILEALKATEQIKNRDFLKELYDFSKPNIYKPLTIREFECFLDEISNRLNLTLEPFGKSNEYVDIKSSYFPVRKKAGDVSKIDVHNLYPQLIYNKYKDSDIPIMIIFKNLFETRLTTKDQYLLMVGRYFLNFFFGYSCGKSNLKYKSPNLSLVVLDFFDNLPDSTLAWDCDILFTKEEKETLKYLKTHNLNSDVIDRLFVYFIDKRSYLCYDYYEERLIDKTRFEYI